MSGLGLLGAALAGVAAGMVNALAGGGTLISFPALTALGLPPLIANLTNPVALTPGYLGAAWAQRRDLSGQCGRVRWLVPAALLGGLAGGWLLLVSEERLFTALVPWLILVGSLLLALQDRLGAVVRGRSPSAGRRGLPLLATVAVALAAVYGGYFGAGLSVILLAALALSLEDTLVRLSGLKQLLAFATNVSAAVVFMGSGRVAWDMGLALAGGAVVGGGLGGGLARRVNGEVLRWVVVGLGLAIGLGLLLR
ncbi:MAG: sulfite exporter TauE/SafE family protein [Cyanobacteriota bacterium]